MSDVTTSWEADLRAAVRRARDEPSSRAVLGPAEGPGGPWVAFRAAGGHDLVFESDAGDSRQLGDDEAIGAAAAALAAWGLVEADPLTCFLEGVDRDPVDDDPYRAWPLVKRLGRARLLRRSLVLTYDAHVGTIVLGLSFPSRRFAALDVEAAKPVNAAQARRLGELGLDGSGERWSGRVSADAEHVEAVVPAVWARVRDVRIERG